MNHMNMNMCSNTSSGCGCGGNGNGNGNGVTMWSTSLKKQQQQQQQKRPRIPKRGPGVAELEKILREQETFDVTTSTTEHRGNNNNNNNSININEGFSSSCFVPHTHFSSSSMKSHSPLPRPNSSNLQSHFQSAAPTVGSMYCNSNRSGEHELFPMNHHHSSCKLKPNLNEVVDGSQSDSGNSGSSESNHANWSYSSPIQKKNNVFPQHTMNQFHGNCGTIGSSGSLSIGLNNHHEPPSNQNSFYNFTSRSKDEHNKMVGIKRSHTSSLDNSLIPPSNFQVLPSFSRYNRPQQSSTNENHGLSGYNPNNESYRDAKWGSTLELSNKRLNSDNIGSGRANFPPFVTSEVPPPPMHMFQSVLSKGNVFPSQVVEEKMENSFQRSESSGQDRKPFFNFLEVKGQDGGTDVTSDSNHGGLERGRGGLDLSLKL